VVGSPASYSGDPGPIVGPKTDYRYREVRGSP
jgi:hypothetical protein